MKKTINKIGLAMLIIVIGSAAFAIEQESVPGEFIVKLKNTNLEMSSKSAGFKQALSNRLGAYVKSVMTTQNIVVVKRAFVESADSAVKQLNKNPMVEYAEPNYIYHVKKTPNDPMFGQLWGMKNPANNGFDVKAEQAWDITTGSKDVVVAIIDTGIDYTHPDIKDNMWTNDVELNGQAGVDDDGNGVIDDVYGYNASNNTGDPKDDHGHGTHCAGTIGGKGDNGVGVAGVNWNVRMMAVKFLDANGSGSLEGALKAIDYATKMGAKVLSNSWGGGGFTQSLMDSIVRSKDAGAVFIAAAGNEYNNNDASPTYPATYAVENIVAVAAINSSGVKADFSNYGKKTVHVGAPGVDILSTTAGKYEKMSGTSMATPHVSGVAALILANEPTLTGLEVKQRLLSTAQKISGLRGKTTTGGLVDAYAALTNTQAPPDMNDPVNWATTPLDVKLEGYKANDSITFDVEVPGAKEFALYFQSFDTEASYDVLSIIDESGKTVQKLSGNLSDTFSIVITGSKAKLSFKSDASVQKTGFVITKAAYR